MGVSVSDRLWRLSTLLLILLGAAPAYAQSLDPRPARKVVVGQVCAEAIERYCPTLAHPPQPHNQVICLKPFRTSLTPPCRAAVAAQLR